MAWWTVWTQTVAFTALVRVRHIAAGLLIPSQCNPTACLLQTLMASISASAFWLLQGAPIP